MLSAENFDFAMPHLNEVAHKLGPLAESHRLAFALVHCERMAPFYTELVSSLADPDTRHIAGVEVFSKAAAGFYHEVVERLWLHALGQVQVSPQKAHTWLEHTVWEINLGAEDWCERWFVGEIALGVLASTLLLVGRPSPAPAVQVAASMAYEVFPGWLETIGEESLAALTEADAYTQAVEHHPWVEREKQLHLVQLDYLAATLSVTPETVLELRQLTTNYGGQLLAEFSAPAR